MSRRRYPLLQDKASQSVAPPINAKRELPIEDAAASRYNSRVMLVSEIGEFELIDRLAARIDDQNARRIQETDVRGFRMLRAIGDDAAAWDAPPGLRVITTDTMVEGVHFRLDYTPWRDLGWKCLATNISDVAAMGCVPTYAIITLGLRPDLPVEGLEALYDGMMDVADEFGGAIVGGDIVRSPAFFITVALQGAAPGGSDALMLRDAAAPGDLIAVTGPLGASAGGLRLLASGAGGAAQGMAADAAAYLVSAHNRPTPRVGEGVALADAGVRCAMDISDGLMDDLAKLCRASGVGARVYAPRAPADARLKAAFPDEWLELALGGGEDYELLFVAPPAVMRRAISAISPPPTVVGTITEYAGDGSASAPRVTLVDARGKPLDVAHGGWDHFRRA